MKIGYVRVSTPEQNTLRQEVLMEQLGVEQVYVDRMSGKDTQRPQLQAAGCGLRSAGTIVAVNFHSRARRNHKAEGGGVTLGKKKDPSKQPNKDIIQ